MRELPADLARGVRLSLYGVTIVLAAFHVGQSIILHQGIPGDMADGRLANCILEHLYRAVRGHGEILSPAQFYPTKGTLFYSDAHFGTAPFYIFFRAVGASMARAFQYWFVFIAGLNTAALLFLLRRLRVHPLICCPLAFFGTSSAALAAKTGHPQVMPFFPFIFALAYFIPFLRRADARSLGISLLWIAYQNACYLYHGYFSFLIFGLLALLYFCFARNAQWLTNWRASLARHGEFLALAIATSLLVIVLIYYPYARFSAAAGTRSMTELREIGPNLGAWFSASPYSPFYAHQSFYKANAATFENTLFASWIIYLLMIASLIAAVLMKREADLRLGALLALTSVLFILAITSWGAGEANLYLWFADRVGSIRAFRSFTRVAYLLFVLESISAALLLNHFFRAGATRVVRHSAVALSFLCAMESLAFGQNYYSPLVARLRADALVKQWRAAGDHEVLLFAPGATNQPLEQLHLDCWHAALITGRATINGYSGNLPGDYYEFLDDPSLAHAEQLRERLRLPESKVSLVTEWAAEDKARLGLAKLDPTPTPAPVP